MKIRFFAALLSLCIATPGISHAQAIYASFTAEKLSAQANNNSWMYGPTFGIYFDRGGLAPLHLGIDARGTFVSGSNNVHLNSGLIGPRVSIDPHVIPIKPYVEALLGAGNIQIGNNNSSTNFEYQLLGGVEYTILPRIDWRIIEFSYGGISAFNGTYNPKQLSTGLVVRF